MRLAALAVLLCAGTASADSPKLAEAKHALDEVRYDDAQRLLVAAIKEGGNSAAAMREIYQLSANTALVLGQTEAGAQYYRRWLALDPQAQLPDSVAPKFRAVFTTAQADMAAKGAIAISASLDVTGDGRNVDVSVVSDPLTMVRGGCQIDGGNMIPFDIHGHAWLATAKRVAVCDESNNRLVEVNVMVTQPAPPPATKSSGHSGHSFIARPSTWWLIGGVNALAATICLGLELQSSNDTGRANTGLVIAASITGGVAVASLVTGTILYFGRDDQVVAAPTTGGAALAWSHRF